ncbi:MAG: LCP family protein [Nocardioides sp.]|nr:LCP family protein [Nocardioides sp.]
MRRRLASTLALGGVLAAVALTVPDATHTYPEMSLTKVSTASGTDTDKLGRKNGTIWLLLVGSDARPGQNMNHTRGDALHLIGLNPNNGHATNIGIPRDSYVNIPGHGRNKINAALQYGGPRLMGQAVGNLVGVQPQYVLVSSFSGTSDMIIGIGGVDVYNPRAFRDAYVAPYGFKKGKIHIRGPQAVDFARARHGLPNGDFGRSMNQARVIAAIHRKIVAGQNRPGFIARGVASVMSKMSTTNINPRDLYRLAYAVAAIDPGKVTSCVVQGGIGNAGAASVVFPNVGAARAMGNDARNDAWLNHGCR